LRLAQIQRDQLKNILGISQFKKPSFHYCINYLNNEQIFRTKERIWLSKHFLVTLKLGRRKVATGC
jgi:hypothetical protein